MVTLMTVIVFLLLILSTLISLIHFWFSRSNRIFRQNPYLETCIFCRGARSAVWASFSHFDQRFWSCSKCSKKCLCGNLRFPTHVSCHECFQLSCAESK